MAALHRRYRLSEASQPAFWLIRVPHTLQQARPGALLWLPKAATRERAGRAGLLAAVTHVLADHLRCQVDRRPGRESLSTPPSVCIGRRTAPIPNRRAFGLRKWFPCRGRLCGSGRAELQVRSTGYGTSSYYSGVSCKMGSTRLQLTYAELDLPNRTRERCGCTTGRRAALCSQHSPHPPERYRFVLPVAIPIISTRLPQYGFSGAAIYWNLRHRFPICAVVRSAGEPFLFADQLRRGDTAKGTSNK